MWVRKFLDRYRGLQPQTFCDAMERVKCETKKVMAVSPSAKWKQAPITPEEESLYYGVHIHSESNPLGLHTHIKGGKVRGGHTHGPQNRYGAHHHKKDPAVYGISIDGSHTHDNLNCPDGEHDHVSENFG